MIEFDDSFEVPALPDRVMERLADVRRVAQCVPGASIDGQTDDGVWLGTMAAAFGPKKLRFSGKVRCEFDMAGRTGVIMGGGTAAGRGASISVRTEFDVREAPGATAAAPRSIVAVRSKTDMQGVLAPFAAAGGAVLAAQLMREFSDALTAQLAAEECAPQGEAVNLEGSAVGYAQNGAPVSARPIVVDAPAASADVAPGRGHTSAPPALSVGSLLWRSLWGALRRLLRQLAGKAI